MDIDPYSTERMLINRRNKPLERLGSLQTFRKLYRTQEVDNRKTDGAESLDEPQMCQSRCDDVMQTCNQVEHWRSNEKMKSKDIISGLSFREVKIPHNNGSMKMPLRSFQSFRRRKAADKVKRLQDAQFAQLAEQWQALRSDDFEEKVMRARQRLKSKVLMKNLVDQQITEENQLRSTLEQQRLIDRENLIRKEKRDRFVKLSRWKTEQQVERVKMMKQEKQQEKKSKNDNRELLRRRTKKLEVFFQMLSKTNKDYQKEQDSGHTDRQHLKGKKSKRLKAPRKSKQRSMKAIYQENMNDTVKNAPHQRFKLTGKKSVCTVKQRSTEQVRISKHKGLFAQSGKVITDREIEELANQLMKRRVSVGGDVLKANAAFDLCDRESLPQEMRKGARFLEMSEPVQDLVFDPFERFNSSQLRRKADSYVANSSELVDASADLQRVFEQDLETKLNLEERLRTGDLNRNSDVEKVLENRMESDSTIGAKETGCSRAGQRIHRKPGCFDSTVAAQKSGSKFTSVAKAHAELCDELEPIDEWYQRELAKLDAQG